MNKRGQIIGGGLKDIIIREKTGENLELGELLIVESASKAANKNIRDYSILQIKDIEYRSQAPQSTHELLSGMELEGYNPDLGFMEPELTNYVLGRAKSLLHVQENNNENEKDKKPGYITKSPKRLPDFFSPIRSIEKSDLKFLEPENIENSIYLGDLRSGSTTKEDVKVYIDLIKSLTHHILIPATTGRGKSNLVRVMLWSILDSEGAGILVLDPHNEYYGDNVRKGLRNHPKKDEKLEYYSPDSNNESAQTLAINIKKIRPNHFSGIGGFSSAQKEAMRMFYNKYGENWIKEVAKGKDKQTLKMLGINETTADVLKRKIETKLGICSISDIYYPDGKCTYKSNLFIGGDSGLSTINDIIEALENGKIVIIDSSKLSDFEELFVGSIISSNIFNRYKRYNSVDLKSKPVISIVIEEAPRVLGKDALESHGGNNIYGTIAREGRKFKIGLIAITQLSSVIPRPILANMNTKIILGNEMSLERSAIIDSASQDLSDDNRIIASLDKGEAIVSSVFTRFAIPIYTPEFEKFVDEYIQKMPKEPEIEGETELIG
ncbi:MAG: ATP-binding protein [Methanobacterium sp.]|uniref:ATP-binding protein n=1 Tax=Methanobacterium sp. TaxID=2164 RepID=UPI003D647434|nr:ATP-binding protein [Methanobacterium sp.]